MRKHSAGVITAEDVTAVDEMLVQLVRDSRNSSHVVIDSHAVTKEKFGFRVTPFNLTQLHAIGPTMIFMLYAASETVIGRITSHAQGRPIPSLFEATMHTNLQATVAIIYSIQLGIPVYFLDSSKSREELIAEITKRLC